MILDLFAMPRNGGAAAQPTFSAEQLEQLKAFVQGALEAEDEERLLEVLGHFKPRFLMLGADSPEGEQLRGALKVMAYNMEAMQLTDTTLAKSKRLFVGNADLLPHCVRTWQRLRDANLIAITSTPPVQQGALPKMLSSF